MATKKKKKKKPIISAGKKTGIKKQLSRTGRIKNILSLSCTKQVKIYKLHKLGLTNKEVAVAVKTNAGHVWNVLKKYKDNPKLKLEADKVRGRAGKAVKKTKKTSKKKTGKVRPVKGQYKELIRGVSVYCKENPGCLKGYKKGFFGLCSNIWKDYKKDRSGRWIDNLDVIIPQYITTECRVAGVKLKQSDINDRLAKLKSFIIDNCAEGDWWLIKDECYLQVVKQAPYIVNSIWHFVDDDGGEQTAQSYEEFRKRVWSPLVYAINKREYFKCPPLYVGYVFIDIGFNKKKCVFEIFYRIENCGFAWSAMPGIPAEELKSDYQKKVEKEQAEKEKVAEREEKERREKEEKEKPIEEKPPVDIDKEIELEKLRKGTAEAKVALAKEVGAVAESLRLAGVSADEIAKIVSAMLK